MKVAHPRPYSLAVAMEELLALPDLKLPVTFTSDDGTVTKKFNDKPDKGGEGYVWHVGNEAWKVFTNRDTYDKKFNDCEAAKAAGVPMGGDPNQYPYFKKGTVTQGSGVTSEGFVIVSWWLNGRRFFGKIRKSFKAALKEQNISHSRGDAKYQKVRAGCVAANKVHLRDIQGFVDGQNADEPLAFFDIHTGTSSEVAQQLEDDIIEWGNQP